MKRWLMLAILGIPIIAQALPAGHIDTSFGEQQGYTVVDVGASTNGDLGLCLQPDGKIVTAGLAGTLSQSQFAIIRYTMDGLVDTSFGPSGTGIVTKTIGPGSTSDYASDVTSRSDGKIIACGLTVPQANQSRFALLQLNYNGLVDTDFGDAGVVRTAVGPDDQAIASAIRLQSDGKIIVVGFYYDGDDSGWAIVRYLADGELDTTFGADHNGIVLLPVVANHSAWALDVLTQSDGKILVAGYYEEAENDDAFQLVRLTKNGRLDNTFGDHGVVRTTGVHSMMFDFLNVGSIALQADGKIIFVGNSRQSGSFYAAIARYETDGSLDTSFGVAGTGLVFTKFGSGAIGVGTDVQADGKIVVSGLTTPGLSMSRYLKRHHAPRFADFAGHRYPSILASGLLARYNATGSLDTTFGSGGYTTKSIDPTHNNLTVFGRMAATLDGKIVVSGATGLYQPALSKRHAKLPVTFAIDSMVARYIGKSTDVPDGEINAAKEVAGCLGLCASDVDKSVAFYSILRNSYYDCAQAQALGIRC